MKLVKNKEGHEEVVPEIECVGCPWKLVTPYAFRCAGWYTHYSKGHLPREGGIEDQSAHYVEAMRFMTNEFNRYQNEEHEERMSEIKRKSQH